MLRTALTVLAMASVFSFVSSSARADEEGIASARTQVDATLAHMRATSVRVRDELRLTRKRGTKAQITCVDEALSRSDVALRRAREVGEESLTARARGDVATADSALRRLAELKDAQRVAALTATTCSPRALPLVASASTTTVKLSVDRNVAPAP